MINRDRDDKSQVPDFSAALAEQFGINGDSQADRLLRKYFLLKTFGDLGEAASMRIADKLLPNESKTLELENMRLQNRQLRRTEGLPFNDDDLEDHSRHSSIGLLLGRKASEYPKIKFLDTVAAPSPFGFPTKASLSNLSRSVKNGSGRSGLARKLFSIE